MSARVTRKRQRTDTEEDTLTGNRGSDNFKDDNSPEPSERSDLVLPEGTPTRHGPQGEPGALQPRNLENGESLKQDEEFWFGDGTIFLVARDVEFRVYMAPLANQSPVLKDLFAQHHPTRSVVIGTTVFLALSSRLRILPTTCGLSCVSSCRVEAPGMSCQQ